MLKSTLSQAFNIFFHKHYNIEDFLNLDIQNYLIKKTFKNKKGEEKELYAPKDKLKKYHNFLNRFIVRFMKENDNVVFSYKEGTSVYKAVYPHKKNNFFLTIDIKSFFDNISKDNVKKTILENLDNYTINPDDIKNNIDSILNLLTYENKLPRGFSTSPILSNAILYKFDNKIEEFCKKNAIVYSRFSDDLIFSSENKINKNLILENINRELKNINSNLEIKSEKTKLTNKYNRIKILGLIILPNGHITVDKKYKKEIEVCLHYYLTNKEKLYNYLETNNDKKILRIYGLLNYINGIDKQYIQKLRKKYGNYIIDSFMHKDKRE